MERYIFLSTLIINKRKRDGEKREGEMRGGGRERERINFMLYKEIITYLFAFVF